MSKNLSVKTSRAGFSGSGPVIGFAGAGARPEGEMGKLLSASGLDWDRLCEAGNFSGRKGQVLDIISPPGLPDTRLVLVGLGRASGRDGRDGRDENSRKSPESPDWTSLGGRVLALVRKFSSGRASIMVDMAEPGHVADLVAGLHLRNYDFDKYKSAVGNDENDENHEDDEDDEEVGGAPLSGKLALAVHVGNKAACDRAIRDRMATVRGTILARDLVNEPPNVLGPVEFARQAGLLSSLGVDVEILTPARMQKLGMGALLAVARGSAREPRMVIMRWNGGSKDAAPLAFVGKGVVFDSGGISLKPGSGMQDMKGDMGGAAAVVGLMKTLALRKAGLNVVGVIGLVENMPDGSAYRPGDIVTAMSGTTIEIINTDAEGRLVLADALWYTQQRFRPRAMIDLATLTGAIMVSLGHEYAGMFSNDDQLAAGLYEAGQASGEKLWRMPLGPAYDKLIKSRFADIKNTGGRFGGAITAAQFLQRFVNDVPWAHLDIAGAGFGTPSSDINKSWAPGFGVAVLDEFLRTNYEK